MSASDAEREAFERFGTPEIVAAFAASARDGLASRFAAALEAAWQRKWWIVAPTVLAAVVTSVLSSHYLPTRYRSETTIHILLPEIAGAAPAAEADRSRVRFQRIRQSILSGPHLERIIDDFDLYGSEREGTPLDDLILEMRRNIEVNFLHGDRQDARSVGTLHVGFVSPDPTLAKKITDRLASLFVQENLNSPETQADGGSQLRARQQLGEQYKVAAVARLPDRPLGPSRLGVNVAGTFAGLGLSVAAVSVRRRSRATSGQ